MTVSAPWTTALIAYALMAFGLAYIAGHALITRGAREWAYGYGFGNKLVAVDLDNASIKPGSTYMQHRLYPLRWLVLLIECPACAGWWIGLVAGYYFHGWPLALAASLFTTSTNFLIGRATGLIARPGER